MCNKYLELEKKQSELTSQLAKIDEEIKLFNEDKLKLTAINRVQSIKKEISEYLHKINSLLSKIAELSKGLFVLESGRYVYKGEIAEKVITAKNALFILKEQKKAANVCIQKLALEGITTVMLAALGQALNTLYSLYEQANSFVESYFEEDKKEANSMRDLLNDKRAGIEKLLLGLNEEIHNFVLENQMANSDLLLSSNPQFSLTKNYLNIVQIPFGFEKKQIGQDFVITNVVKWDLRSTTVLHLSFDEGAQSQAPRVMSNVVFQCLKRYPVSSIKFAVCNKTNNAEMTSFFSHFNINVDQDATNLFLSHQSVALQNNEIEEIINLVEGIVNERIKELMDINVLDYNYDNPETAYPLIFLVIEGYSNEYQRNREALCHIFKNGYKAGVYIVAMEYFEKDKTEHYGERMPDLYKEKYAISAKISFPNNEISILYDDKLYCGSLRSSDFDERVAIANVTNAVKEENTFLSLKKLLSKEAVSKDFSTSIRIPVARFGRSIFDIEFNSTNQYAHAVVSGTTGSGKSSLLQSIVLGGSYLYSPAELQFWLLDFKDGASLSHFKSLKHVKMMCMKSRPADAEEIVRYIGDEFQRRKDIIGSGDIVTHNKRMTMSGKEKLPRLIIIIDEFTVMPKSCNTTLAYVAQMGRSLGMSLVICSQFASYFGEYDGTLAQIHNIFELKNEHLGRFIGSSINDSDKNFAWGKTGNCLFYDRKKVQQMRLAYAGGVDGEQQEFIAEINAKWKDFEYYKPIMAGNPERCLRAMSDFTDDVEKCKEIFDEKKQVDVPLGFSRIEGKKYWYKVDRDNPLLVILGNESRAANVEYSLAACFDQIAENDNGVYYIDLNINIDRDTNAMLICKNDENSGICFGRKVNEIQNIIDEVYDRLCQRKYYAQNDEFEKIGKPIELIIHCADRLIDALNKIEESQATTNINFSTRNFITSSRKELQNIPMDDDLEAVLQNDLNASVDATRVTESSIERKNDLTLLDKVKAIVKDGKDSRIYTCFHFEIAEEFETIMKNSITRADKFKDVIISLTIPEKEGDYSGKEINNYLMACGHRNLVEQEEVKMNRNDFIYNILIDDNVSYKIIPFEWVK